VRGEPPIHVCVCVCVCMCVCVRARARAYVCNITYQPPRYHTIRDNNHQGTPGLFARNVVAVHVVSGRHVRGGALGDFLDVGKHVAPHADQLCAVPEPLYIIPKKKIIIVVIYVTNCDIL
jgi:hypothetical protein